MSRHLAALLLALACTIRAEAVDFARFLARHDLIWERTPTNWFAAPFLGNGTMGAMLYRTGTNTVRIDVGRGDAYDHRKGGGAWHQRCRLPIGHFTLDTLGAIQLFNGRLDLWNAEFNGQVATDRGALRLRAFVHATRMVLVCDVEASGGESGARLTWHPAEAIAPARSWGIEVLKKDPKHTLAKQWAEMPYTPNPPFQLSREGDEELCFQPLLEGGETATAWRRTDTAPGQQRLLVSIAHTYPAATARADALAAVRAAAGLPVSDLVREHRAWWQAYYPQSFVSIPDAYWEGFYWIQMYKLASATRADGPLIDTMGPWFQPTTWPCVWFNLNAQLTYWCAADANRMDLGESLIGRLDRYRENLVANMPAKFKGECAGFYTTCPQDLTSPWAMQSLGDLPWAMHNYWLFLRRSMDERRMREQFFPTLKLAINTYLHLVQEGADGRLHIEPTFSPEYGVAPDTNYNLALLRWGCATLVELCARFGLDDPLLPRWKDTLARLVDYPVDENGYMVGAGMPFEKGHRHYSHLLMAYPLYLVNVDQPGGREVIDRTLRHWMSFKDGKAGYTWTGSSSLASALGDGDRALEYLNGLKQQCLGGLSSTTMYREGNNPVTETPFSAAQSLHGMLLQSWGDKIRVFPAVSSTWRDASFADLRAEGAFLVSAERRDGRTTWIRVQSLAGEPCRVQTDMVDPQCAGAALKQVAPQVYELALKRGETAVLTARGFAGQAEVAPVGAQVRSAFGLRVDRGSE